MGMAVEPEEVRMEKSGEVRVEKRGEVRVAVKLGGAGNRRRDAL